MQKALTDSRPLQLMLSGNMEVPSYGVPSHPLITVLPSSRLFSRDILLMVPTISTSSFTRPIPCLEAFRISVRFSSPTDGLML